MGPCYGKVGDLIRRGRDTRVLSPTPFSCGRTQKEDSRLQARKSPHQELNLLTPDLRLPSLQNCEKQMSVT